MQWLWGLGVRIRAREALRVGFRLQGVGLSGFGYLGLGFRV